MTVTIQDLPAILLAHGKWLRSEDGGTKANLRGANLCGADLYGADLSGAYLYGADLSGADLYGANLSGTNLRGANLYGADLRGANLSSANLSGTNLRGANLYGANLYGADLRGANLSGANLSGANLSSADDEGLVIKDKGFFQIGPIGSRHDVALFLNTEHGIYVRAGCFWDTLPKFEEAVAATHGDNEHARNYQAAVALVKTMWGAE